jgi:hypothetical protein
VPLAKRSIVQSHQQLADRLVEFHQVKELPVAQRRDGHGEIFAGPSLMLQFNNPLTDSPVPGIVVAPNVGFIYTGDRQDFRTWRLRL